MYQFKIRKGHGSSKHLIEFNALNAALNTEEFAKATVKFVADFDAAIDAINPFVLGATDLWMNDEIAYSYMSSVGPFELSVDHWGLIFIMAEKNQPAIHVIGSLLEESDLFEKLSA